ncbi:hypothetical protein PAXINDRAFT_18092 [Paxillus involutus ATCC 200175]|uniref:Uncharacterized protein n=1 Tax=Paxillus involutus ATCC 200175 TaxID=664439 RepID=A0A0C9TLZ3_PAXIN|nr:hypothetical protein PAXINDRAFT_18092 [Paxillus involutus ATCC 200175]
MTSTIPPITIFHREYEGNENPSDWIRRLMMSFPTSWTDTERIERFEMQCATSSQAAQWFSALPGIDKISWQDFLIAFNLRWPPPIVIPLTAAQKKDRLRAITLKEEDIGVMTDGENGSQPEWGHIRWARHVARTAQTLGDINCQLVDVVLDNMPDILQELIGDSFVTWNDFLIAIANVPHSQLVRLWTCQTADKELQAKLDQLQAQVDGLTTQSASRSNITSNNPTSAPYRSFSRTQPVGNQPQPVQLPSGSMGRSNPYYGNRQQYQNPGIGRMSQLQAERIHLAAMHTNLLHHLNTEIGRQAYNKQISDWVTQHGANTVPDFSRPFLLKLRTAALGSRECFGCGTNTYPSHRSDQCPNPNLPTQEKQWREAVSGAVGRALRVATTAMGTPVQYLTPTQYQTYQQPPIGQFHYPDFDFDVPPNASFSGNGNGLQ